MQIRAFPDYTGLGPWAGFWQFYLVKEISSPQPLIVQFLDVSDNFSQ